LSLFLILLAVNHQDNATEQLLPQRKKTWGGRKIPDTTEGGSGFVVYFVTSI